jgi:DNA-binding beta-propeller fold protein YncE
MATKSMRLARLLAGVVLAAGLAGVSSVLAADPTSAPVQVLKSIEVGGATRWDYIAFDAASHRLYVPHAQQVEVIDTEKDAVLGTVTETPGVHGVALVPDLNLGFSSNGTDGTVSAFDLKTFKTVATLKAGKKPDAILYDAFSKRVFCFNGNSGDVSVFDPANLKADPVTIAVGGKLEYGATDGAGHVYVNVEDKSEIVAIDSKEFKVLAHWPLPPGEEPSGLAIDIAGKRLFAGCSNKTMAIVDTASGKVIASPAIGSGVDGVAYDPKNKIAYSANGRDGTLSAVTQDAKGSYVVTTIPTVTSARTIVADQATGTLYLPCKLSKAGNPFGVLVVGQKP